MILLWKNMPTPNENNQLSDEQVLELSRKQPEKVFVDDNGRIAFCGSFFNSKKELEMYIKTVSKSAWLFKFLNRFTKRK